NSATVGCSEHQRGNARAANPDRSGRLDPCNHCPTGRPDSRCDYGNHRMIDYVSFHADLIPEAATLLANRHCQDRLQRPELSPRFELSEATQQALTLAYQRPHTHGVAALQGGKLLGYLFGTLTINSLWGRTGWIRPVGCALDGEAPLD